MLNLNFVHFFNHLKLTVARKAFFFDIFVNKNLLNLLNLLYKLNVIRRFSKITPKKYRIFPMWRDTYSTSTSIKLHYRALNPIKLNLKALYLLKMSTFNSHILLNTPKGVLTHNEAILARVGGTLICTIS
jgi:ribosomal protein S8